MEYRKCVTLKDGRECVIRSCTEEDARAALEVFILTHAQTDWLSSYPDEINVTVEQEAKLLRERAESANEAELAAEVDGKLAGLAGLSRAGVRAKSKHRATFGISIDSAFWGLGIGRAMLRACIECAKAAGYIQLELDAVADNKNALELYKSEGFVEYGRNPLGFRSRVTGWQELVMMRLELDGR